MDLARYVNPIRIVRGIRRRLAPTGRPDRWLRTARGIIHVGANTGQERDLYARFRLPVVWVEPIPSVFAQLQTNLAPYPKQIALQALVSDRDGERVTLHVSNNDGLSSSIFDLDQHRDIWPVVDFVSDLPMTTVTLPTLLRSAGARLETYDVLVLDTQGAELLVLKGATPILPAFRLIKAEVPDFPSYRGCVERDELSAFMAVHGFHEAEAQPFANRPQGGTYFDVLYAAAPR